MTIASAPKAAAEQENETSLQTNKQPGTPKQKKRDRIRILSYLCCLFASDSLHRESQKQLLNRVTHQIEIELILFKFEFRFCEIS